MDNENITSDGFEEKNSFINSNDDANTDSPEDLKESIESLENDTSLNPDDSSTEVLKKTTGNRFCINCGAELLPDQRFCSKCGANQEARFESNTAVEEFNRQLAEGKKKKKKKLALIIALILIVSVLCIGGKFAFMAIRHSIGISKADKALAAYKTDEIDYDSAIADIKELKLSKDADVASHATDTEKTIEKLKTSKDHFSKGELYKGKKDYKNAINHYEAVIKEDPNYEKAQNAINEIIPLWKKSIPAEIDALLKNNKSDDADELIKTFLGYSPDDVDITNIRKFIEAEDYYAKGYLNSAQDIFKTLPKDLKVKGITVKSRLDTLKKYSFFVKMCGEWAVTKYYMETKEVWSSGRWNSWYRDGASDGDMYLKVTCVIGDNGKVTVSGDVKYAMYTNYSSISSYVNSKYFTSSFKTTVSLPSDSNFTYSFITGEFTHGNTRVTDNQKIVFGGKTFSHSIRIRYIYSMSCDEYYSSNETFATRVEKY